MPLPRRPEYRLAFGLPRLAAEQLRAFQPDIVHIALAPDLLGYSAWRVARSGKIPVVASYHTRYEAYFKHYWFAAGLGRLVGSYLRRFYGACREVYVPTQSMVDALLADGLKNNFQLWPRGVDTAHFNPGKRSVSWRQKHGLGEDELVVVQVARLVREKQLDTLVATLRLLEARGIPHRSVIVGDGPDRVALERELPQSVFTGFLEGEDLAQAYASSDIFLFPSETESFGNVTLEAMASGLPCVCADATGSRSLVAHGVTGYCAKPGDAEEFASYIETLALAPSLRLQMGDAARQRALGFSWDGTMERIHGYYQALLMEKQA
jgi:glycosyltransferase involved in cell wall biosynthesis